VCVSISIGIASSCIAVRCAEQAEPKSLPKNVPSIRMPAAERGIGNRLERDRPAVRTADRGMPRIGGGNERREFCQKIAKLMQQGDTIWRNWRA
jgi:hypothetical protein